MSTKMLLYLVLSIISTPHYSEGQNAYDEADVSYYLFTKDQQNTHFLHDDPSMKFDNNATIIFLIHGWTESHEKQWYAQLTDAYLSRTDSVSNVVQVDWSKPAKQDYVFAAQSVKNIGDYIANYIVKLVKATGIPLDSIHIIGHSLGGQVAGCLGAAIQERLGRKFGRITGLDPAGPLFYVRSLRERLDESDADVVFVIHTDAGIFGTIHLCGTADVFPNSGRSIQPGCPDSLVDAYCSHHKSYEYFIDAVNYGGMVATRCTDYPAYIGGLCKDEKTVDVGGAITKADRGKYYLKTNSKSPYAMP